jgi:hypothetical protein
MRLKPVAAMLVFRKLRREGFIIQSSPFALLLQNDCGEAFQASVERR